jgi:hypothetical protein
MDVDNKDTHRAYESMKEEPNFFYYQDLTMPAKLSSEA